MRQARQLTCRRWRGKARLLGGLGLVVLACGGAAADFHAPATPAERALDRIISAADSDDYLLDNLLGRAPVPKGRQVDYGMYLTKALIEILRREERMMVQENCVGRYRAGEICGFDYIPVTCGQDSEPVHKVQTASETRAVTIVKFRYAHDEPGRANTYRLVRDGKGWKIDDILCPDERASFRKLLSP